MANRYTPRRILITGGSGFIASHVINKLVKTFPEYNVTVLDKLDFCANLNPCRSSPNFEFVKGDVACADLVNQILRTESIDTVMHFAAQTDVHHSFRDSFESTENVIYGTNVILEACRALGQQIKRFIHVSTDEVYGETGQGVAAAYHEDSQLQPSTPYAASNAAAELMVMAFGKSYRLPVIVTRGNRVYGPNRSPEELIPKYIVRAIEGLPLRIQGDGSNVRNYTYYEDVVEAFDTILHKGEVQQVYDIGTNKERTVLGLANDICRFFTLNSKQAIQFVENRPSDDQRHLLDNQKLKNLGWYERTSLEEGLRKTMQWYVENYERSGR